MDPAADEWTARSAVNVDKESSRLGWQTGNCWGSSALLTTFAHLKRGISDVIVSCAHATSNNRGLMECSICYCASVPALSRKVLFYFPPHLLVMSLTGCCFFFLPPSSSRFFSLFLSHTICSGFPVIDSEWVSSRVLRAGYYDNCGCAVGFKKKSRQAIQMIIGNTTVMWSGSGK